MHHYRLRAGKDTIFLRTKAVLETASEQVGKLVKEAQYQVELIAPTDIASLQQANAYFKKCGMAPSNIRLT